VLASVAVICTAGVVLILGLMVPAPAPPSRPMTRTPARLRGARIPPADSKPPPEPRYHDRTPGSAIHCPEAIFPGAVTRRRSAQAGDPAGVPFR
jgi:hypothetical protein